MRAARVSSREPPTDPQPLDTSLQALVPGRGGPSVGCDIRRVAVHGCDSEGRGSRSFTRLDADAGMDGRASSANVRASGVVPRKSACFKIQPGPPCIGVGSQLTCWSHAPIDPVGVRAAQGVAVRYSTTCACTRSTAPTYQLSRASRDVYSSSFQAAPHRVRTRAARPPLRSPTYVLRGQQTG